MPNKFQAFVGISALLAALPATLADSDDQQMPLLSGSVCRVRDSLDFLDVSFIAGVNAADTIAVISRIYNRKVP